LEAKVDSLDKARITQLNNIQKKTGKTIDEIRLLISESGFQKHAEIRQMFIDRFGLGFGDATMLVHFAQQSDGQSAAEAAQASPQQILEGIYTGTKTSLRPLHEAVMNEISKLGEFSIAPKKTYLSLRRKRQFAMIGPGSKNRLEIGLNMKGIPPSERLLEQPAGGMCQYKIFLSSENEIDEELIGFIKTAYNASA
jgi:predicted transport protein